MLLIPLLSFYLSKPQEKRHDRRLIGKSTQQRHRVLLHRAAKTKGETEEEGRARATHRPHMAQCDMNPFLNARTHTYTASLMAFQTQRGLPGNASKQDEVLLSHTRRHR